MASVLDADAMIDHLYVQKLSSSYTYCCTVNSTFLTYINKLLSYLSI